MESQDPISSPNDDINISALFDQVEDEDSPDNGEITDHDGVHPASTLQSHLSDPSEQSLVSQFIHSTTFD
jgi:hypothetical protein